MSQGIDKRKQIIADVRTNVPNILGGHTADIPVIAFTPAEGTRGEDLKEKVRTYLVNRNDIVRVNEFDPATEWDTSGPRAPEFAFEIQTR